MKKFFLRFVFQNSKMPFLGVNQFFFHNFFAVLAFKTIDTQIYSDQYLFFKTHKKTLLNAKNGQNGVFDGQ